MRGLGTRLASALGLAALALSCRATKAEPPSRPAELTAGTVAVRQHRMDYRSGRGREAWLVLFPDGRTLEAARRWERPSAEREVESAWGSWEPGPDGVLRLLASDTPPAHRTWSWRLDPDALVLGAVARGADGVWRYRAEELRADGTYFSWRATLAPEEPVRPDEVTRGTIDVSIHDSPSGVRTVAIEPTEEPGTFDLNDVTGDGMIFILPTMHLDLERGTGELTESHFGFGTWRYPRFPEEEVPPWLRELMEAGDR